MNLITLIKNLVEGYKQFSISSLPTKGYFYPKDFSMKIKKAKEEDIIEYEYKYDSDNVMEIVECVKRIVKKNTIFNDNYSFEDLKSVDIIFIFLEIVSYTTSKPIKIHFFNDQVRTSDFIEFNTKNFNYYNFESIKKFHNESERVFEINGYKFSMPSVGVENCLSQFLLSKSNQENAEEFTNYSYDFLFFLGWKNSLSFSEIENLITIFNFEIESSEKSKIKDVIDMFMAMIGYQLRHNDNLIDVKSNLDLEKIWKI